MRLSIFMLIFLLVAGTIILWPMKLDSIYHPDINGPYQSVCLVTSSTSGFRASGVLLESGYVLTAAHVIDRDHNGVVDYDEETVQLKFPQISEPIVAKVLACSDTYEDLDIAILEPETIIDLPGVKIMSNLEYLRLQVGAPITTIGMQNGIYPSNMTDGRIVEMRIGENSHRNSANSYYGNSGGGVYHKDKLAGIAVSVGLGTLSIRIPFTDPHGRFGTLTVPVDVPLSNFSRHTPAPVIRKFLIDHDVKDALWEKPPVCPYHLFFPIFYFNAVMILWGTITILILKKSYENARRKYYGF